VRECLVEMAMIKESIEVLWKLGFLPFHINPQEIPSNGDFPEVLPFALGFDKKLDILLQVPDRTISETLEKVYQVGSRIGIPLGNEGFGLIYLDDFKTFISKQFNTPSLSGLRILEIGCGNGFLLERMQREGAYVIGIEPDVNACKQMKDKGLKIINDFFDPKLFEDKFDLIIHYSVLEHVQDPLSFISDQKEVLTNDGMIIFAVPDCRDYIYSGDISMFIHEHWNYFFEESLENISKHLGLKVVDFQPAKFGKILHCCWKKGNISQVYNSFSDIYYQFVKKAKKNIEKLKLYIESATKNHKNIGIYCPNRFINYHLLCLSLFNKIHVRYFDDDPRLRKKYFPPIEVPIENRSDLLASPVDNLLIMSRSFGESIKKALSTCGELKYCRIKLISDVFE
jgi:2-polyprenyl-3-methyl-5-hydroxy-6-metoxy-1,4-benzoquinol methylase